MRFEFRMSCFVDDYCRASLVWHGALQRTEDRTGLCSKELKTEDWMKGNSRRRGGENRQGDKGKCAVKSG